MRVYLAYLANPRYGGWVSYTAHLAAGLRAAGHEPVVVKIGKRTEERTRDFGRGLRYQNVTVDALHSLARQSMVLVTAVDKAHHSAVMAVLAGGAAITIHDPTELKRDLRELLPGRRVFIVREAMREHLPWATYLPHPYARAPEVTLTRNRHYACTLSRIDFDKYTQLIIQANQLHGPAIHLYGHVNAMYAHFKLDEVDASWRRHYHGVFPADNLHSAVYLAAQYRTVVDMSAIKGDGGGSQYTFLEACDAGCRLVLNAAWRPTSLMADCVAVASTPAEIRGACDSHAEPPLAAHAALLRHHDAATIAADYVAICSANERTA
jgi:hypothetical protein